MEHKKELLIGCIFAFFSAFGYALMNALAKYATLRAPDTQVIFLRFFFGFVIALPFFIREKNIFKTTKHSLMFARSIMSFAVFCCIVFALNYIPVANVVLLSVTYPLFIPIITRIFHKKKLKILTYVGIGIGFLGVALILHPSSVGFLVIPSLVALLAGALTAVSYFIISDLNKTETKLQILLFLYIYGMLFAIVPAIMYWQNPSWKVWIAVVVMGLMGNIFQYCLNSALSRLHTVIVAPIMFCAIFFGMIIDWMVWENAPTTLTFIGTAVVIIGLITTLFVSSKNHHLLR